jgi:tetratricopeptide (TPR) repeat protein
LDEAVRLHDLAVTRQAAGKLQEALPLCRQALAIMEHAIGPHHPDVANILNTWAGMYEELGESAEAERLAQRSVAMIEEVTGGTEMEVLQVQSLGMLAEIYRMQGRYAEAEPLYQQALAIKKKVLGPEHPDMAMTLNNLAVLYKSAGKYAKAEPLYRHALAIFEAALGPTHPKAITCRQNYAELLREKWRQAKAAALESHPRKARPSRAHRSKET